MRKTTMESVTMTDSKIVEATINLVGELGYKGTTTRQIAQRAGVDEVTLFRRFGSKEALAKKAVGFAQREIRMALESAGRKKTGEMKTDLANMALLLMEVLGKNREAVVGIMFEAKREPYFASAISGMVQFILNLVREYIKSYELEKSLSKKYLEMITLSFASYVFFRVIVRERLLIEKAGSENRKKEVREHVEFLLRNLPCRDAGTSD